MTKQEFLKEVEKQWYLQGWTAEVVDWAIANDEVIHAHYRSSKEQLKDNTWREEHYVVTDKRLLKFLITASNIKYDSFQLSDIVKVEQTFALPKKLESEYSLRKWKESRPPEVKITFSSDLPEEVLSFPENRFREDFKGVVNALSSLRSFTNLDTASYRVK